MDPLAHTLIGATIGETKLNQRTPLARATLIIAANLPDIDATCMFFGRDVSLGFRRGHTHGVLAMFVLPVALTLLVIAYDRVFRAPKGRPGVRPLALFLLAFLGILTHPALDWLNTYGVRLLMPFSEEWFYGDAVFIIDPWLWLLGASVVMPQHSQSKRQVAAWIALGLVCSLLVIGSGRVPPLGVGLWCLGLAGLVAWRRRASAGVPTRSALVVLFALGSYIAAMVAGSAVARSQARAWYAARGIQVEEVMAGPLPSRPFMRDIVVRSEDRYHFAKLDWFSDPILTEGEADVAIGDGRIARRALATRPGLETWIRFPAFEVQEVEDGFHVRIRDVRYDRKGTSLGRAEVWVPKP